MNITVIGSSSSGNGYIINTEKGSLLLECGMKLDKVEAALNYDLSKVVGLLITHEHGDHSAYIDDYIKHFKVYATVGTLTARNVIGHRNAKVLKYGKPIVIGNFKVMAFRTEHDASEPCGFLIVLPNGEKLVFATDTSRLFLRFSGISYWMVECNYDKEILQENVNNGSVHIGLARRIVKSHLSLSQLCKMIDVNDFSQTKTILLIHLSNNNSNRNKFVSEIARRTGKQVIAAKKGQKIELL